MKPAWFRSLLVCIAWLLAAATVRAAPREVDARAALSQVVSLTGTWRASDRELSAEDANHANLDAWDEAEVPGQRRGRAPFLWYALDVRLPPPDTWPAESDLSVLLPPFLPAFEVLANGVVIGSNGHGPPASVEPGVMRHMVYAVPRGVVAPDGRLRVVVHVWIPGGREKNTGPSGNVHIRPEGAAIGPTGLVTSQARLVHYSIRDSPELDLVNAEAGPLLGIAFVFLVLFVFAPSFREYGWFVLMLVGKALHGQMYLASISGALLRFDTGFLIARLANSVWTVAALMTLRTSLELRSRSMTAAVGALAFPGAVTLVLLLTGTVASAMPWFWPLTFGLPVLVGFYAFFAVVQRARDHHPDAKMLAWGFGASMALQIVSGVLFVWLKPSHEGPTRLLLDSTDVLADTVLIGTMAVVLARRYRRSMDDLARSLAASTRFVPEAFLKLLGRSNVTDVERGDVTHREMVVLFSDIRGFTTLAEALGPADTIALLNRYLSAVEPAIVEHAGFVNQYYGDGLMALFANADDALKAATAMQTAVERFNDELREAGSEPIVVGVGLNAGKLAMGTIGGELRLDTGVVGDAVNTAARIEGMTKLYGARVLASESVIEQLSAEHAFSLREIDHVIAKGKHEPVRLYQLMDAEKKAPDEQMLGAFAHALTLARGGLLAEARAEFDALPHATDPVVDLWRQRCETLLVNDGGWDGITVLDTK